MPFGYQPITTIKDYDKNKLQKRIDDMKKRGYELLSQAKRSNGYDIVYYAKLKDGKHEIR